MIQIPISFRTPEQKEFFNLTVRNSCFSGGFGNGKTYVGCQKMVYLLSTFPGYKVAIARFEESKLRQSTMRTFFKPGLCPPELYAANMGGNRADSLNKTVFVNGSEVIWMNLKDTDDGMIRGLEVNSVLIDQAEEITEAMFLMLSARVGRWDGAKVPPELLKGNENWPRFVDGRPKVPNYMAILCNPDSELHWIYRRFHPDSEEWKTKYKKNHFMVQGATTTATVDPELLETMMENDKTWVDRFVLGKWGIPGGQIHMVPDQCILRIGRDIDSKYVETIIEKGHLARVLDHGDSAPTCCLWFSAYKGNYYCYREYYQPNALISDHRKAISDLSGRERYLQNLIDPQCAKKTMQKYGGRWSQCDEYSDKSIDAPPIFFEPADNNEMATRNRISELLRSSQSWQHPITHEFGAPKLYFIERSPEYPSGCYHAIQQLRAQKRKKIGSINGQDIFSDERDDSVTDHAYDPVRYYCASHFNSPGVSKPRAPENSFSDLRNQLKMYKATGYSPRFGVRVHGVY